MAGESVQLIFGGDGRVKNPTMLNQVYASALFPYHMGIPDDAVTLYISSSYHGIADSVWEKKRDDAMKLFFSAQVCGEGSLLARDVNDYHNYFLKIHARAHVPGRSRDIPQCNIRIIMGHAHGTASPGQTYIRCGTRNHKNLHIGDLVSPPAAPNGVTKGNARILTIVDCCAGAHIVSCLKRDDTASLEGIQRFGANDRASTWQNVGFPLACCKQDTLRGFSVGYQGQRITAASDLDFEEQLLSDQIFFPVTHCVLFAAKAFQDGDPRSMNAIFDDQWQRLHAHFIDAGDNWGAQPPYRDLAALQNAIRPGDAHLVLNVGRRESTCFCCLSPSSLDCIVYERQDQWFLVSELAVTFGSEDWEREAAESAVEHVVATFVEWHKKNPTPMDRVVSDMIYEASEGSWERLKLLLGPHQDLLQQSFSLRDGKVTHDDHGAFDLHFLAVCSPVLTEAVKFVNRKLCGYIIVDSEGGASNGSRRLETERRPGTEKEIIPLLHRKVTTEVVPLSRD